MVPPESGGGALPQSGVLPARGVPRQPAASGVFQRRTSPRSTSGSASLLFAVGSAFFRASGACCSTTNRATPPDVRHCRRARLRPRPLPRRPSRFVTRMRETMRHRGPDGGATWVDRRRPRRPRPSAAVDHRPVGAAAQPMCNEDGTLWVVFNGEIYNHAELRAELERARRPPLEDRSLRHRGDPARASSSGASTVVHRFRGMFAFALWDARRASCGWCATASASSRSTTASHHGRLTFASEIKALLEDPEQRARRPRGGALPLPLVPHHARAADAVRRHPQAAAGHLAARRARTARPRSAATGTSGTTSRRSSRARDDEIAERVLAELRTAVKLRKVSDVPVGVFLSGGLDSSTNAALFSEGESRPVRTFSIGYDRDYASYRNELALRPADGGADRRRPSRDRAQRRRRWSTSCRGWCSCRTSRSPIRSASAVLRRQARARQRRHRLPGRRRRGRAVHRLPELAAGARAPAAGRLAGAAPGEAAAAAAALRAAGYGHAWQTEYLRRGGRAASRCSGAAPKRSPNAEKRRLLSPRLRDASRADVVGRARADPRALHRARLGTVATLNWMSYVDLHLRLPELLLMRVDKMTMGVASKGGCRFSTRVRRRWR